MQFYFSNTPIHLSTQSKYCCYFSISVREMFDNSYLNGLETVNLFSVRNETKDTQGIFETNRNERGDERPVHEIPRDEESAHLCRP